MADSAAPSTPPPAIDSTVNNPRANQTIPSVPAPPQSNYNLPAAQLRSEYVSGAGVPFVARYIKSLPQYIDDISRDFGSNIYEKMLLDPQVNSCIRLLVIAIIEDGIELEPAVQVNSSDTKQPGDEEIEANLTIDENAILEDEGIDSEAEGMLSEEICDWVTKMINQMDRPFMDVLYEMLFVLATGNKVAEQIWKLEDEPDGSQRLYLKKLKTKQRETTAFVVDQFMEPLGMLALIPGQGYPVLTGTIVGDPSQLPNMLPLEKFFILQWGMKDSDPRGNSLLRCVYNSWWLKTQVWGEYLRYLSTFATGFITGTTQQNAQALPDMDAFGNPLPGSPILSPEQRMANQLEAIRNGSAVVTPFGSSVNIVQAQGAGNVVYNQAINLFDLQIAKGILCQTLASELHAHQSRAAASTHQDILDEVVVQARTIVVSAIQKQIIYRAVLYNWGKDIADRLCPKVRAQQAEKHNWATDANSVAGLVTCGFLDKSQYTEMDERLGLPQRDPDWLNNLGQGQGGAAPPPAALPPVPADQTATALPAAATVAPVTMTASEALTLAKLADPARPVIFNGEQVTRADVIGELIRGGASVDFAIRYASAA